MSDEAPAEPPLERRKHPNYVARTAALTYGLVFAGMACLLLGIFVRGTAWRSLETIFNLGFCGALIAVGLHWFARGESTACPQCGRRLTSDPRRHMSDPITFVCAECRVEWLVQPGQLTRKRR